jgi:hypothetical protein
MTPNTVEIKLAMILKRIFCLINNFNILFFLSGHSDDGWSAVMGDGHRQQWTHVNGHHCRYNGHDYNAYDTISYPIIIPVTIYCR